VADLTTLQAAKDELGITDTDSDDVLTRLIALTSGVFLRLTGNAIFSSADTWTTYCDRGGAIPWNASFIQSSGGTGQALIPRNAWTGYPLLSVQSLTIGGSTILASSAGSDGYLLDGNVVRLIGYVFSGEVVIAYTAGFAAVPPEVTDAVAQMVALRFKGRERIGVMGRTLAGTAETYQTLTLPVSIQSVIDAYTRPGI
jgi:hypothetical protein